MSHASSPLDSGTPRPFSLAGWLRRRFGALAVQFTDSQNGTSVTFGDSGANHYGVFILASLDNAGSSIVFSGTSTFDQDFSAAAAADVTSAAGSALVATVGNLSLSAGGS